MKDLSIILSNINSAIENYETKKLGLIADQSEILRDLSVNLHWLTEHRIKANEDWMSVYFNSKAQNNASKEREADFKTPELYKIRHFMTSGYKVLDSMRTTISANK